MALSPALRKMVAAAQKKYQRADGKTVKFKEGKTTFRIVADNSGDPFWRDLGVHWIKTEKGGKPVAVVGCHSETYDQPCPICAAIEKAAAAAVDDETLELIKEWKARRSVLVPALIRSGPDASEDPQIVEMTPTTWGKILAIIEEYGEEMDPFDLEDGIDFVMQRSGKGLDTEYNVMPAAKSKPVDKSVLKNLPDIDAFIEQNFFRGDEPKAINAIASATGVALALPTASSKKLLTSSVVEEDEDFDQEKMREEKPSRPAKRTKVVEDDEKAENLADISEEEADSLLDELDDLDDLD